MNPERQYQPIAAVWVERAWQFGHELKDHRDNGGSPASVAVTGPWEVGVAEFALGKAAEVGAACFFGLDPELALLWNVENGPDDGFDLALPLFGVELLLDVKGSAPAGNVIWPQTKNSFYWEKNFHLMLGVSVDPNDLSQTWIEGFVTKREFYLHKRIADGVTAPRLTADTWYLPKKCLHPLPRGQRTLPHERLAQTIVEMMAGKTRPPPVGEWSEMWARPFDRPELVAGNGAANGR
jgi:hypothetical protein